VILWCDGAHSPQENMRRDAALLAALEARAITPGGEPPEAILRLFRFDPQGLTLGHSQVPERDLDLERCRADRIPWAVRPTGGRAIFHAQEWTYSLAAAIRDPRWGGTLSEAYDRASRLVVGSLQRLGLPAALASRPRRGVRSAPGASAACFAATARHEIVLRGLKLAGSAQRRGARGLLQQGSLLLGPGHARLAHYLPLTPERRETLRHELLASTAHAGEWIAPDAPLERWAESLLAELPAGTRRVDAAAGASLLTLAEAGSYTAGS